MYIIEIRKLEFMMNADIFIRLSQIQKKSFQGSKFKIQVKLIIKYVLHGLYTNNYQN